MEIKGKTRTEQILTVMYILTWVAFIGLAIKAGAMLISYGVSWVNPEASRNLYNGLSLDTLRQFSFRQYSLSVFFMVVLASMKAFVFVSDTQNPVESKPGEPL